MNIYDFLRFIVQALSSLGPVKKEDAFNAVDLINQLESRSAFGEIGRITSGSHLYVSKQRYTGRYCYVQECGICGKDEFSHE